MCNGANLAFRTSAFREINGYAGNQQHASGDDQFLLEKIIQRRGRSAVCFLFDQDAIVYTEAAGTAMDFFQQRLRWVSKSKGYTNPIVIIVGSVTYLTSFGIFLFLIMGFFSPLCWGFMAVAFIGKSLIDFPIVFIMAGFFRKRGLLKYYLFTELFQTGYVVFTGIAGLILPYRWKGRKQFS
jgi:cellulose synthase/poly-beta-1,6-N-acetylglucosamine synthase-like glycosyltransferase